MQETAMSASNTAAANICKRAEMLIDGRWTDSISGKEIAVQSPGNRQLIANIPRGGAEDVDRAVQAAHKAFAGWSRVVPRERGRMLQKIADAADARVEELARIVAEETGNAIRTQARPEAKGAADILRYFGGLASELKGETIPLGDHVLSYTRREPIGVVGAIIPWNAPVLLAALKIAPALCAGNTLVLKAAEDAPLGVLWLAAICQEQLPKGVLNVVTGYGEEAGAALSAHERVRKLSFTGSTEVGKLIMRAASERIVPVSLELGGKSPSIVYPDANEEWVVDGIISAMRFTRQSQSCTAGSRLFLHADIFDDFLSALAAKTAKLKIGNPLNEATDVGAIINEKQFQKVCGYVEEGMRQPEASCCSEACRRRLVHWRRAISPSRRCSPTTPMIGAWRGRRSLVPCWSPSVGPMRQRPSAWPTTPTTASPPTFGRTTSDVRFGRRTASKPAGCRSTRVSASRPAIRMAASSRAGSGASSRSRACSTASRNERT